MPSKSSPQPSKTPISAGQDEHEGLTLYRWLVTLGKNHLWEERREGRVTGYYVGHTRTTAVYLAGYTEAVALLHGDKEAKAEDVVIAPIEEPSARAALDDISDLLDSLPGASGATE